MKLNLLAHEHGVSPFNVFSQVIYSFLIKIMPFLLDVFLSILYCYAIVHGYENRLYPANLKLSLIIYL